jgi:hypothetical protein
MKPREPRRKIFVKARVRIGNIWRDVCVRDISSRGLLLQGRSAPSRGTYIEICRGRHAIVARVVWSSEERFGVQAQDRINIEGFVGEPDVSGIDYRTAVLADPAFDRRAAARAPQRASIEQRIERSRRMSATFQFAVMIAAGAVAASTAFSMVGETLAAPLQRISTSFAAPAMPPQQ